MQRGQATFLSQNRRIGRTQLPGPLGCRYCCAVMCSPTATHCCHALMSDAGNQGGSWRGRGQDAQPDARPPPPSASLLQRALNAATSATQGAAQPRAPATYPSSTPLQNSPQTGQHHSRPQQSAASQARQAPPDGHNFRPQRNVYHDKQLQQAVRNNVGHSRRPDAPVASAQSATAAQHLMPYHPHPQPQPYLHPLPSPQARPPEQDYSQAQPQRQPNPGPGPAPRVLGYPNAARHYQPPHVARGAAAHEPQSAGSNTPAPAPQTHNGAAWRGGPAAGSGSGSVATHGSGGTQYRRPQDSGK